MSQKIAVFKQPKPFYVIFLIEFWERFGFYGMWVILAYYLTRKLDISEAESDNLFSAFTALLYALVSVGGYIGDKVLGTKRTIVLGAVILAFGYFLLGFDDIHTVFYGLGFVAAGNGLFKANPSSLLSKCYAPDDVRLDGAFTMYYMAVNIGSLISMPLVPYIADHYGFGWGFRTACFGLILGLLNYLMMYRWLKHISSEAGRKKIKWSSVAAVLAGAIVVAFACAWILHHLTIAHALLAVIGFGVVTTFIYLISKAKPEERAKMIVALVLIVEAITFFVLYQQMPTSLNFFAINNVQHSILGLNLDPQTFQVLNPFWIILASPILAYIYGHYGNKGRDLTMPAKFTLGMFLCAIGFISLYVATFFANAQGIVSSWWLVLSYGFQSVGELLVSGLGLAMVARLVPQRMMGFIMGAWFMATAVAMVIGGFVASLTSVPKGLKDHFVSLHTYGNVFLGIGLAASAVAVLMWLAVPLLKKGMQEPNKNSSLEPVIDPKPAPAGN